MSMSVFYKVVGIEKENESNKHDYQENENVRQ